MTCIIALMEKDGTCWMAGDRAVSGPDYGWQEILPSPKIVRHQDVLIGASGYGEHWAILTTLELPPVEDDLKRWAVKTLIPWWRKLDCYTKDREASILIAGRGRIISANTVGAATEGSRGYLGIGYSGAAEAILWAASCGVFTPTRSPAELLKLAMLAEQDQSPAVRGPFDIVSDKP